MLSFRVQGFRKVYVLEGQNDTVRERESSIRLFTSQTTTAVMARLSRSSQKPPSRVPSIVCHAHWQEAGSTWSRWDMNRHPCIDASIPRDNLDLLCQYTCQDFWFWDEDVPLVCA